MKINRPATSISLSPFKSSAWWKQIQDGLRYKPRKLGESSASVGTPNVVDEGTAYALAVGLNNSQLIELVGIYNLAVDNVEAEAEIERKGLEYIREAVRANAKKAA